jgi:Tfp pilus assembly protein FimV
MEAMDRLFSGKTREKGLHDGSLILVNLAVEAGVGRATLYRAEGVVEEFDRRLAAVRESGADAAPTAKEKARLLKGDLANARQRIRDLESQTDTMAQQIQALALQLHEANRKLIACQGSDIVVLSSRK